jgi:hypothetical protein
MQCDSAKQRRFFRLEKMSVEVNQSVEGIHLALESLRELFKIFQSLLLFRLNLTDLTKPD